MPVQDIADLNMRFALLAELADKSLELVKEELREQRASIASLDSKAFGCSTVSGGIVTIVGVLGKLDRIVVVPGHFDWVFNGLLLLSVSLAVVTIFLSLRTAKILELSSPHDVKGLIKELRDLRRIVKHEDFGNEMVYNFTNSRLDTWKHAITKSDAAVELKARKVRLCQFFLAASLSSLGLAVMSALLASALK